MVAVTSGQADDSSPEDKSGVLVQEREIITRSAGSNLNRQGLYIILNKMYNLIKYDNMVDLLNSLIKSFYVIMVPATIY
jgi:hypothetical protein